MSLPLDSNESNYDGYRDIKPQDISAQFDFGDINKNGRTKFK